MKKDKIKETLDTIWTIIDNSNINNDEKNKLKDYINKIEKFISLETLRKK